MRQAWASGTCISLAMRLLVSSLSRLSSLSSWPWQSTGEANMPVSLPSSYRHIWDRHLHRDSWVNHASTSSVQPSTLDFGACLGKYGGSLCSKMPQDWTSEHAHVKNILGGMPPNPHSQWNYLPLRMHRFVTTSVILHNNLWLTLLSSSNSSKDTSSNTSPMMDFTAWMSNIIHSHEKVTNL